MHEYPAKLKKIIDGDTIQLIIDVGFYMTTEQRIRLLGIDTPERGQEGYLEAIKFVQSWIPTDDEWPLVVQTFKTDSFGRWLGIITISDWEKYPRDEFNLNIDLLQKGLAVEWKSKKSPSKKG